MSILGIADHKLEHTDGNFQTEQHDKCTLITSSAWRNSNYASCGGVGLLISNNVESSLCDVEPINERILCAHFNGNPATSVIVHYAPTEGSDGAEEHYVNLTNVINSIPKHNVTIITGDCNAHIGKIHLP